MFEQPPDPSRTYLQVKEAIKQNKRPTLILHKFLDSGAKQANLIGNYIIEYRETVMLLCSPKGRKWLYFWLNDTLDFLQKVAREGST